MIRQAERDDIPAIVEMHLRIFGPPRGASATDDLDYEAIFFDSPWYDPEIRSLMFESDGHIVGFMGIAARPMEFQDRQIKVAIPTRFMVDAEKGGALVAVQLLKTLAAGPQEAAINDGSNEVMREVWLKSGAELMVANSMQWVRSLQPAERLRRSLRARGGVPGLASRLALPGLGRGRRARPCRLERLLCRRGTRSRRQSGRNRTTTADRERERPLRPASDLQ